MIQRVLNTKKYNRLYVVILIVILLSSITVYSFELYPQKKTKASHKTKLSNIALSSTANKSRLQFTDLKENDALELHLETAASFGLPLLEKNSDVDSFLQLRKLVPVNNNPGYHIDSLTHSKPVMLPEAYEVLKEMGRLFVAKAGNHQSFTVTSVTRTMDNQKHLRRLNPNATKGNSSHSFGCSFDISYLRFNQKHGRNKKLQKVLEEVLLDMRNDRKIYVIVEKRVKCFHITVINKQKPTLFYKNKPLHLTPNV